MSIRGLFRLFLDHENTTESHQNIRNLNKIILFLQRILSASAHTYFLAHRAFSHILGPVVFSFIYPISMSGLHFGFLIIFPHYTDAFLYYFFPLNAFAGRSFENQTRRLLHWALAAASCQPFGSSARGIPPICTQVQGNKSMKWENQFGTEYASGYSECVILAIIF